MIFVPFLGYFVIIFIFNNLLKIRLYPVSNLLHNSIMLSNLQLKQPLGVLTGYLSTG